MPEAKKFIAFQARSGNGHGYLTQPPRPYPITADPPEVVEKIASATSTNDEPEAPSGAWLNATSDRAFMLNQQARLAEIAQAQKTRPQLSMEQRMADGRRRARLRGIDIRAELVACKRMLEAAKVESDKRAARTVAAAERRWQKVEVRLDQMPSDLAA